MSRALNRIERLLEAAPDGSWFGSNHGKLVRCSAADLREVVRLAKIGQLQWLAWQRERATAKRGRKR